MKSYLYALIGTALYAITGVVIEQKLEKFNNTALVLLFVLPMIPIALLWLWFQKTTHQEINFPTGSALWIVMILGVAYFFADYFFLGAFTAGGNVMTVSTILLLTPAIAAIIKYLWVGGKPNVYQVSGYVLIAAAMLLVAKGNAH
ncbi:MAG: DMT family transporter [Candidatus Doudnabacteria bacterium]|nr:DMT family transporter [Candidatus Doudnabacteria bacterium]